MISIKITRKLWLKREFKNDPDQDGKCVGARVESSIVFQQEWSKDTSSGL